MLKIIQNIDYFRKLQQDVVSVQTKTGGCISLLFFTVFITLLLYQIKLLIFGELIQSPFVEASDSNDRVRVNINVTFHEVGCGFLSIDYQDITGTHVENIEHDLYKFSLDESGNFLENSKVQYVKKFESKIQHPSLPQLYLNKLKPKQDDCYGAELTVGQSCKTCNDVLVAYSQRGWPIPPLEAIAQCSQLYKQQEDQKSERQKQEELMKKQAQQDYERLQQLEQERNLMLIREQQRLQELERQRQIQEEQSKERQRKEEEQKKIQDQIQRAKDILDKQQPEESREVIQQHQGAHGDGSNPHAHDNADSPKVNEVQNNKEDEEKRQKALYEQDIQVITKQMLEIQNFLSDLQVSTISDTQEQKIRVLEILLEQLKKGIKLDKQQLQEIENMKFQYQNELDLAQKQTDQSNKQQGRRILVQSEANLHEQQKSKIVQPNLQLNFTRTALSIDLQQQYREEDNRLSQIQIFRKNCEMQELFALQVQIIRNKNNERQILKNNIINNLFLEKNTCVLNYDLQFQPKQTLQIDFTPFQNENKQLFSYEIDQDIEILELQISLFDNNEEDGYNKNKIQETELQFPNITQQIAQTVILTNSQQNSEGQQRRNLFAEDYGEEHGHDQSFSIQEMNELKNQIGQGCQVYGHMYVKKVPGNFHISFHSRGLANMFIQKIFSMKHTIHLLEFTGEEEPTSLGEIIKSTNPVDGVLFNVQPGNDQDYYMKLVKGVYENKIFRNREIYSFTILESQTQRNAILPGVTFKYEFDPISMKYTTYFNGLASFLVSFCAIFGGAYSLSKYFNSALT